MAIQGSIKDKHGVVHTKSYARIESFNRNFNGRSTVQMATYHNKKSCDAGYSPIMTKTYEFPLTLGETVLGVGVSWMTDEQLKKTDQRAMIYTDVVKKLDEWKSWIDV